MTVSRAGLTSKSHSMRCLLSPKDEEAFVAICLKYARRGMPLNLPDFLELTRRYKGYPRNQQISRHFASNFIERHDKTLCCRTGKTTSPARSSDIMDQKTEEFIADVEPLIESNSINKNNLFVFDETYIGDPLCEELRIGELRKSGGGNVNMYRKRGKAVGAFIPFSKCDGTTPFRVFILKDKNAPNSSDPVPPSRFFLKYEESPTIRRLYLTSKTGCMTIPLFKIVLDYFHKWWSKENPGLKCFFVCDQLPVHMNNSVDKYAKDRDIKIIPIMAGSSHWPQVQDQLPFGTLKKKTQSGKK